MIAIIDYGAGNLSSVKKAFDFLNVETIITKNKDVIEKSDKMIIPGVGAFSDAMETMQNQNIIPLIKEFSKTKKVLGICLGMQILFSKGFEHYECSGLDLIYGSVTKIDDTNQKIPHIGWNDIIIENDCSLLNGIQNGDYFYFVHSFKAETNNVNINAYCNYGEKIPALVSNGNVYGAQFHPEKSSDKGILLLKNFANI